MMNMVQMLQSFPNFMQMMRGQNPDAILQNMKQTGRITQQQIEQATQQANSMMQQMSQFKAMFGFK